MAKRDYLSSLELMVLLGVLRAGREASGIPIAREMAAANGREIALASVYSALSRLEDAGMVSSALGERTSERGGRAKAFFRLTSKGLHEVREAQAALVRLWSGLPELEGGRR